ncbi:MAG: hypothetical protein ACLFPL_05290 [Candidatus Nanoarchaeia archaeon]
MKFYKIPYILLIIILNLSIVIGVDDGTRGGNDEEDEWSEDNFEDSFEKNPEEGFAQNAQKAWETLMETPSKLIESARNTIQAAFNNDKDKYVNLIEEDTNLLEDETVREYYERAIGEDSSFIQSNPEAFRQFASVEGISVPEDLSQIEITNYNRFDNTITLRNSETSNLIRISKQDLGGGQINIDGTVTLSNGVRVTNNAQVASDLSNEFSVSALNSDAPARVKIENEEFTASQMIVGRDSTLNANYVRTVGSPVEYMDEQRSLKNGRLAVSSDGSTVLRGNLVYRTIDGSVSNGFIRPERSYDVEENTVLTSNPNSCGSMSCIVEQGDDSQELIKITAQGNNNIRTEYYSQKDIYVEVDSITSSNVQVDVVSMSEAQRIEYQVSEKGVEQIGVHGEDNGLTLKAYALGPNGKYNEEVYGAEDFGVEVEVRNLEDFSGPELPELLQGVDLNQLPNSNSVIDVMNSLNLPSDLNSRYELYQELVDSGIIEEGGASKGSAQMNLDLIKGLKSIKDGDYSTSSTQIGVQEPDFYEVGGVSASNVEIMNQYGCSVSNSRNCQIGSFNYRVTEDGFLVAGDGEKFDPSNGMALINENEDFINRETGEVCDEPCSYSSQADAFTQNIPENFNNLQSYSPTQVIEAQELPINGCSEDGGFNCRLGKYDYDKQTINGQTFFEARDGFFYDENGNEYEKNANGELVPTGGKSSQAAYFKGGELEDEARGNLNQQPRVSTKGDTDISSLSSEIVVNPPMSNSLREPTVSDVSFDRIKYVNQGAIRNKGLNPVLENILQASAEEVGVEVQIFSGGQCSNCRRRTGSTRHNNGNAADINILDSNGRLIPLSDSKFTDFMTVAVANGIKGAGADGPGRYMGQYAMHLDVQSEAVWGHNGKSANAPPKVRRAVQKGKELRCERYRVC